MQPPVLFTRLGSTDQVNNSVIGASGTEAASVGYAAGMFGNGLSAPSGATNRYIVYPSTSDYSGPAMCFEMWIKVVGRSIVNGQLTSGLGWAFHWNSSSSNFIDLILYTSGFTCRVKSGGVIGGFGGTYQTHADFDVADGEFFHLAAVYNVAGIDGGSDTQRIYFNGAIVASTTTSISQPAGSGSLVINDYILSYGNPIPGVIDNFKIYPYDKIDFSDRFIERSGVNPQVIII